MVELESEIGEASSHPEEGHGAVEVMVGDGVEAAGAFEESEIVSDKTRARKTVPETAGEFAAGVEISCVRGEAQDVGEQRQR